MPEIDCEEYAAAVLKILENEEDLSRRARERVLAHYTLERSVETHRRIFEQTLSGPRHASGSIGLKHPMFYFKHDPVPVMYVEWDGEPMSYIRAFLTDFTKRVAPVFSGRVMDMGAGEWTVPRRLFSHCAYYAVDVRAGENTDLVADLLDIPVPDESLDGIICHQVLEHVTGPPLGLLDTRVRVFDLMRPPQLERVFPTLPGPAFGSRSPRESNDGCTGS